MKIRNFEANFLTSARRAYRKFALKNAVEYGTTKTRSVFSIIKNLPSFTIYRFQVVFLMIFILKTLKTK